MILETSDPSYEVTFGCVYPVKKEPGGVTLNGVPVSFAWERSDEHEHKRGDAAWRTMRIPAQRGRSRYELFVTR